MAWGIVTLVFTCLDHFQDKERFLQDWSPRQLRNHPRPQRQIPRLGSLIEIAMGIIAILWWIQVTLTHSLWPGDSIRVELGTVPGWVVPGFILLAIIGVVNASVNLARPYWTYTRAGLRVLNNVASGIFLAMVATVPRLVRISGTALPSAKLPWFESFVNQGLTMAFGVAGIVCLAVAIADVVRMARVRATPTGVSSAVGA